MFDSGWILPGAVFLVLISALIKKVNAYDAFIKGVKEGFSLFVDVYPALLAMMFAIRLLRDSGIMDLISSCFRFVLPNLPAEIWPMVLFRPISGSASMAILIDIFKTCGVDSLAGIMASVIQGATDTTFYVITLYFSSVGVRKIRSALGIGLIADAAGILAAILLTLLVYAHA